MEGMLGWINKKIGTTGAGGQSQDGAGGNSEGFSSSAGSRDNNHQHQQHHNHPQRDASLGQPRLVRRGTFFDAVGGAIGRGSRKKDDKSEAVTLAEQLDARRAEKISSIAFKLVREIQRILKEARETQTAAAAAAAAAGRSAASRTQMSPSSVPSHKEGVNSVTAGASTADHGESKSRWAGTDELLLLLDGGSLGGEVEDRIQQYVSMAEVQAKMSDLVEQALVPESHGDLCGQLLEASGGEGHHPAFVKLCVDAGLPSNLVHCLRIMRVVEFESAMHEGGGAEVSPEARDEPPLPLSSTASVDAAALGSRPQTQRATERIGRLLVTLCSDKTAGVGEQIKPHLPGLLSLAVSAYPPNGAHVQETACAVVEALMAGSLNSSMVWLLHYNKAMLDVVVEMRHLCGLDEGANTKSPTTSQKSGRSYTPRSVSPLRRDPRKRSPRPGVGGGGGTANEKDSPTSPVTELVGEAAEANGLWLTALRATVSTVRFASRFVPTFVQDFESAGGYETVGYMVRKSSIDRVPAMLEQVCLLVSATSTGGVDQSALSGGCGGGGGAVVMRSEPSEMVASNPAAFGIIQSLLAECTPPVEAVCLQGVVGRVSSGTCDVSCLAGGHGLAEQGLDTEDAVVMVAERAVAMRLDRWGREHGMFPPESAPILLSIESSGTEEDDEDEDSPRGPKAKSLGRTSVGGVGEMAADVADADEFRLRLLEAVLGLYSNHPVNYGELETRFHALSFFLCALPYYESRELKGLALKTLEVICVSFKDVHPRDALHSTSTAFTVCLDHMIGLLSDPLSSPGISRKVSLVGTDPRVSGKSGVSIAVAAAAAGVAAAAAGAEAGDDGGGNGYGVDEDARVAAALRKAVVLLEDADIMRRMLEKLLEFDEKKYTAMFQATGILDQVLHPLLKRVLTLNVGGFPGAVETWRAMCQPLGLATSTGGDGGDDAATVGAGGGDYESRGFGSRAPIEETGALALVSRATRLLCGTLALLLGSSQGVCRQFRALRMHDTLYKVIRDFGPPSTEAALAALERASASEPSGVPEDMAFLIELVQGSKSRTERWRQAAALMGLRSILLCRHQAVKDVWRESCGFEAALAAISSLDSAFSLHGPAENTPPHEGDNTRGRSGTGGKDLELRDVSETRLMEAEHFGVIQAALLTLVASASAGPVAVVRGERLVGYKANRRYLRREISYDSLACCLVNSGVVASHTYASPAVKLLFTMVTELPCETMVLEMEAEGSASKDLAGAGGGSGAVTLGGGARTQPSMKATVRNADAVMVILGLLPYLSEEVAWAALGALNTVVRAGGFAEAEALVAAGAVRRAAEVLATALHAQATRAKGVGGGTGPEQRAPRFSPASATVGKRKEAFLQDMTTSRGAVAALSAHLRLTDRLQRRLVEFLLLVASRNMTQVDLAPVIRSVTVPLVIDARGHAAPPTVWPAELALPPPATGAKVGGSGRASEQADRAVWLPGWGTFVPPPVGDGGGDSTASEKGGDIWAWLGVLAKMAECAEDSTPFSRLGGSPSTDMSSLCHDVSGARGGDNSRGGGSGSEKGPTLWRAQQKALVETAIEEGFRLVHVPGLEGNASMGAGDSGGGGIGGVSGGGLGGGGPGGVDGGASWPGPIGYSFACWMRFNPPTRWGSDGSGEEPPQDMKAWSADVGRAVMIPATPIAASAAGNRGGGGGGGRSRNPSESDLETADEGLPGADGAAAENKMSPSRARVVAAATTFSSPNRGRAGAADGLGKSEKRGSVDSSSGRGVDSSSGRGVDGDEDRPFPHPPGRQILWVFAVASPDGRAFLQLFLDLDALVFCLRGSFIRGEVRFSTPMHLVCGGPRAWHHVVLTHARPKSRLLGTRDKISLWVDGELADTVKVDATNFTTPEGPPAVYLGCPHPQAFLDPSVGVTVAPAWHLGPCLLLTEVVDIAPFMFALGSEYTGLWTAENPLAAVSSPNATRVLRHLQALGGAAGFAAIGGDVPHALARRRLRELDGCFNVTERALYSRRADRAGMTDSYYLLLAPEQVTFAYNTRHMERPGGPPAAAAAGGAGGFQIPTDSAKGIRGHDGPVGGGVVDNESSLDSADDSCRPSQVPSTAKRAAISSSLVSGWLFNAARETAPPSAGPGPVACAYGSGVGVAPSSLSRELSGLGGPAALFPLLQRAQTETALCWTLRLIRAAVRGGGVPSSGYMQTGGGYIILAGLLRSRRALLGRNAMRACFEMAVDRAFNGGQRLEDAAAGAGDARGHGGGDIEDRPWHGDDKGFDDPEAQKAEERRACAWEWELDMAFPPREEIDALLRKSGVTGETVASTVEKDVSPAAESSSRGCGGLEGDGEGHRLCPFVLLTDPYALKHVVMNHQVWGLENRALMLDMLQMVHSLVSPHNSKPNCRFNARILHRIGLFRTGLHFLLEASEPLPPPPTTTSGRIPATNPALKIAAFGGRPRPTAAVAAAGLDTRDPFMASCALLLQRVLATCAIQRDFDRVVGATLSTLADGDAASREVRSPGSERAFAPAEAALRRAGLLGDRVDPAVDRVLSGQAIVRLYLLRMLLEVVSRPVAVASQGEMDASEGLYVAGVGSPCAMEAQRIVEASSPGEVVGPAVGGGRRARTRLERWVGGVPPVVDVAEDGGGLPSPLYVGRLKVFKAVSSRALRPDWFISLLETCREEAGVAWTFRLLAAMLQGSDEFGTSFQEAGGYVAMAACLPRYSVSLPVLLPALALALGVPVAALPATAESMDALSILSLLRRNAGTAVGPNGRLAGSGGGESRAYVRICIVRVILPSLRDNAGLLRLAEASGLMAARESSPPTPPTPLSDAGRQNSLRGGISLTRASTGVSGSRLLAGAGGAIVGEAASQWQRAKRVNEVTSAALWEALMNDPSFRITCRSPGVVEALVDVLGGTWDEPEEILGEEMEDQGTGANGNGSGSVDDRVSASGESPAGGFPPQASPHPPAELLRIVIADIVASGGSEVFPSLVRVFASGAAVMGPMLKHSSAAEPPSPDSTTRARDLSPLGREPGSASAGVFQRAILRHLEACCRETIALALNAGASVGASHLAAQYRLPGRLSSSAASDTLKRALESVAAVAAAVAEAAAEGLLPGVETGHLAVGLVLSVLRQICSVSSAVNGGSVEGTKGTALGACQIATLVALRRAIQRESGGGRTRVNAAGRSGDARQGMSESWADGSSGDGVADAGRRRRLTVDRDGNDLLEECLLMIAYNFDALLGGESRSSSASGGGGFVGLPGGSSPTPPPHLRPPPLLTKSPISSQLRYPVSASSTPSNARAGNDVSGSAVGMPSPLDLSTVGQDPTMEAPLTMGGLFADTPLPTKWSSRFDFPDDAIAGAGAASSTTALAADEAARLNMTFSALELANIDAVASSRSHPLATPGLTPTSSVGRSPSSSKGLWESAAAGAAGLVAAADRGSGGMGIDFGAGGAVGAVASVGGSGGGNSSGGGGAGARNGMRESLVSRLRGSTDRAFVVGFVAELRVLLLSDSERVRKLATRLAGALLSRRRAAVQELLGEELINTGFSMLEHHHPLGSDAPFDPAADDDEVLEASRAFSLWLTGSGQEAALREAFDKASDRSYAVIPHVSSAEGLTAALTRAELAAANGGFGFAGVSTIGGGGGGGGSSALSRLGNGVGGALGALGGPNRRAITVDRVIQRADMIARTYERVATSHGHWVWAGADDLAWASKTWRVQLGGLRGKISLWEGGLFGRLMRSPEAIAALGPGAEGVGGGLEEERYKLDIDEGPERTRLKLRPNRAFYDTYEVLAPVATLAAFASSSVPVVAVGTKAEKTSPSTTQKPTATTSTAPDSGAAGDASSDDGVALEVVAGAEMEADGEGRGEAAAVTPLEQPDSDLPMRSGPPQAAEDGNVAEAITAIVKTMRASVRLGRSGGGGGDGGDGGGGRGGRSEKQPLASVYDLDDVDFSALQELERMDLKDILDGPEYHPQQYDEGADITDESVSCSVDNDDAKSGMEDRRTPDAASTVAATAAAKPEPSIGGMTISKEDCDRASALRRDQGRGFSMSESEMDEMYDDVSTTNESVLLDFESDDDGDNHGVAEQGQNGQGRDRGGDEGADGGDGVDNGESGGGGNVHQRGRTAKRDGDRSEARTISNAPLLPPGRANGAQEKASAEKAAEEGQVGVDDNGGDEAMEAGTGAEKEDGSGDGDGGTLDETPSQAPPLKATASSPASGPGAVAREAGWSDRELLMGLIHTEDAPVIAAHDVSRSLGGVEVRRGLLLVCRNTLYFVVSFGREPPLPKPGASPEEVLAAKTAAAAASRSKDPLHGVRRLEKWELGGGAGGIGGIDDDSEAGSVKLRVMLRRKSSAKIVGTEQGKGSAASFGRSSTRGEALATGQETEDASADAAAVAAACGDAHDDILALGRLGVQRFPLDQVHAVYKRRYQLRDVGLEVFDVFGRSVLVSFSTQAQQEDVLTYLLARGLPASIFAMGKSKLRLAAGSSHAQARAAYKKFMQAERIGWTKKWQSGRCTNFAYLMALNTLAGRSFNDITQYPVFPWVLRDYVSEELDLDNPRVFRDLSKPMGAIGEARSRQFTERYAAVIEAAEETGRDPNPPPFHYGTHYSCAGYILHYLLRLEPFTRLALALQGGRFDKADRLFRDIRSSWESASSENLQDVRELTPEFYTLPEFLVNSNGFDLGFTQKGQAVNHVVLPPWAKGDPGEFIRLHRKALECPHVSKNLHSWIGLIFGCKQRGPEAVEAQNVFVHLTYEGEVDIDAIQDPLLREAALAQIHNFGQTPSLVLKKPHPQREMPPVVRVSVADGSCSADPAAVEWHAPLTPPLCIVGAPDAVGLEAVAIASPGGAWHAGAGSSGGAGVGDACLVKDKIIGVGSGAVIHPRYPDKYIRFGGPSCGLSFFHNTSMGATSSSKTSYDRLLSSHQGLHLAPITALACSEDGNLLITGAMDGTCRLWAVVLLQRGSGQLTNTLDLVATLGCHAGRVTCASMCMRSGSAVTGGADGKVLLWDIRRKSFVRELPGHRAMITSVGINDMNGNIVTLSGSELGIWTVNGRLIASCSVTALRRNAPPTFAVSTACADWQDGVAAVTGHDNGDVSLWCIQWSGSSPQRSSPSHRLGNEGDGDGAGEHAGPIRSPGRVGWGGSVRPLRLLRVLSGAHQKRVTFVRVCDGGREMLVGDVSGNISRWQCIRLDLLRSEDLNKLV